MRLQVCVTCTTRYILFFSALLLTKRHKCWLFLTSAPMHYEASAWCMEPLQFWFHPISCRCAVHHHADMFLISECGPCTCIDCFATRFSIRQMSRISMHCWDSHCWDSLLQSNRWPQPSLRSLSVQCPSARSANCKASSTVLSTEIHVQVLYHALAHSKSGKVLVQHLGACFQVLYVCLILPWFWGRVN